MAVSHGYQPMRGAEKQVTQEDMWNVLEKHGGQRPQARESPKEKSAVASKPLEWGEPVWTGPKDDPRGSGYIQSQCGRFSISRDKVRGATMYTAWKCRWETRIDDKGKAYPHRELPEANLGVRLTRIEAEHLCELENAR